MQKSYEIGTGTGTGIEAGIEGVGWHFLYTEVERHLLDWLSFLATCRSDGR
jgi:hypothetical protein